MLPRSEHPVSRKLVSPAALKVLYRLRKSGFRAYLCGGAVRDLMAGRQPKDFDVATDARPQEVRRLFRNARIIGRRFRLVHVIFEGETVEVSTFRRTPAPEEQRAPDEALITSDNTFGTRAKTPSAATSPSTRSSTTSKTFRSSTTAAASPISSAS